MTELEKLKEAKAFLLRKFAGFVPLIILTAGSGLGYLADLVEGGGSCLFADIPNCPVPGATDHAGHVRWGFLKGVPVVILKGRVHYYEGVSIHEVVFLTRLMIMMAKDRVFIILTHATGGLNVNLATGDFVVVRSHNSALCPNPTAGRDARELGTEFTGMGQVYSPRLLDLALRAAIKAGVGLHRGVSYFWPGRTYESRAEVDMMRAAGADLGTMSSVPEAIAAAHMSVKFDKKGKMIVLPCDVTVIVETLDIALVTDMGEGLRDTAVEVSSDEVLDVAEAKKDDFGRLIVTVVEGIAQLAL